MLNLIEAKEHALHEEDIEAFLSLVKIYQNKSLSPEDKRKSTFIIAKDNTYGVYGGAVVHKRNVQDLHQKIKDVYSSLSPNTKYVWAAFSCFCFIQDTLFLKTEDIDQCRQFYRELLEEYKKFGLRENFRTICLTLNQVEYNRSQKYGLWPYIVEVPFNESSEKLFHGLLTLKGTAQSSYVKNPFSVAQYDRKVCISI